MAPAEQFDSSFFVRSGLVKTYVLSKSKAPIRSRPLALQSRIKAFFAHYGVDLLRQNISENGSNFSLVFHGNKRTERSVLIPIMVIKIEKKKFRKIALKGSKGRSDRESLYS